jgi:adenosylcobinamide-GDP ribazoletransferase
LWRSFAAAATLLTVVPLPRVDPSVAPAAGAAWFPLIGGLVGAAVGAARLGLISVVGRAPATVVGMVVLVGLTGALHQDGLADTADGLGARGGGRERRLAAMRDHATGAFGVLALIAWALLLFSALSPLSGAHGLRALIAAGALSRAAAVIHGRMTAPARGSGLGASFSPGRAATMIAAALGLGAAIAAAGFAAGVIATGVCAVVELIVSAYVRALLGGRSGDTLGAVVALSEAAVCVALLGWWR